MEFCWSAQEKGTSGDPMRPNIDVLLSGGPTRSSAEVSVMEMDRRGRIIQFTSMSNLKRRKTNAG